MEASLSPELSSQHCTQNDVTYAKVFHAEAKKLHTVSWYEELLMHKINILINVIIHICTYVQLAS